LMWRFFSSASSCSGERRYLPTGADLGADLSMHLDRCEQPDVDYIHIPNRIEIESGSERPGSQTYPATGSARCPTQPLMGRIRPIRQNDASPCRGIFVAARRVRVKAPAGAAGMRKT
jgi:hypothetical protein